MQQSEPGCLACRGFRASTLLRLWALPHAVPPRTFMQRIKNNLRLARLQQKQLVFPACGPSLKSLSSQHGAQALIFHQTQDAAPYPGPVAPSRGLTVCTWSNPHMATTGAHPCFPVQSYGGRAANPVPLRRMAGRATECQCVPCLVTFVDGHYT